MTYSLGSVTLIKSQIPINKIFKAKIASLLLALSVLPLLWLLYGNTSAGVLFCGLFLLSAFLRIPDIHPFVTLALNALWGCICILLSCVIPNLMIGSVGFFQLDLYRLVMNFACAAVIYGICLALIGKIKPAVITASALLLLFTTANSFIFQFRGTELQPADFLALQTALNVAGQYTFTVQESMALGWSLWLWSVMMLQTIPNADKRFPGLWLRICALIATVLCLLLILWKLPPLRTKTWSNEGTSYNGLFLNFTGLLRDSHVSAPDSYDPSDLDVLGQQYATSVEADDSLPNIVVIMNESYADFRILGGDLPTNIEVTPFADSLQENTIRGYALSSIFGGKTANSEFECLTSLSMANLPTGSVPYQFYLQQDTFSLAHLLNRYGYRSISTHPYFSSGWGRTTAYPLLGFAESSFLESYPQQDLIRHYVSDRELYAQILNMLNQEQDAPLFLFAISMQNHGDYTYEGENYTQTVYLEGMEGSYPMAEQYLTLLHESDNAARELITALEASDRKTIVLFFGDHFPQVEGDFYQALHGGSFDTLSEQMLEYTVPFYIWANFDIPEQEVACTSLNYLSRYLLEAAGLPLSPLHSFLKDMEAQIPAINAYGYYSQESQTYRAFSEAEGDEAWWLDMYACLQYNSLFDSEHKSDVFFKNYLP